MTCSQQFALRAAFRLTFPLTMVVWSVLCWGAIPVVGAEFFVARDGNDAWTGTLASPNPTKSDGPFASLDRARDAVRAQRKSKPAEPSTVLVRGGVYELAKTLALSADDSGSREAPVVWQNY